MAYPHPPEKIAEAFVEQYYIILQQSPENAHKFYQESSLLSWQENGGRVAPATTLSGINERIMSSDFKNGNVETLDVDAQQSISEGVFVVVSGLWTNINNDVRRKFSQCFFLAQQEKGYYVLNDVLRVSYASELTTISAVNNDAKLTEAASSSSVPIAVLSSAADSNASKTEEAVKEQEVKEAVDPSIPKDVGAKVTAAAPTSAPIEKVSPMIKPVSEDAKVEAPKLSYASVVAKPGLPKVSPPTSPKSSVSRVDAALKAPASGKPVSKTSNGVAPKAPASGSSKPASKASNGAPNANPEDRVIYIGGLPYDITQQGVADVMKRFGPLRKNADTVRLIKYPDGFCCGFVEFENADAARRAVHVHYVQFGDNEAYCTFRKSRDNDGRGRSPPRGGSQNGNFKGKGNGQVGNGRRSQSGNRSGSYNGQARDGRRSENGNRSGPYNNNNNNNNNNGQARGVR